MATIANTSDELLVGPIRGDLLGADHLAARARTVARSQRLATGSLPLRPARLLARLAETRRILSDARDRLLAETAEGVEAGPAAEWLLDNYYVVQEHLQEIRTSLPGGYYRELPELDSGPLAGYPRAYEIAIALISHTEARVDLENVDLFVEAFQGVTPLSVRELWAMPAMLRLGLIESVRRMTLRTVQRLDEIALAAGWAERLAAATARGGAELRATVEEFTEAEHTLSPHFISRLLQSLRQSEGVSPSLVWLEHWMREAGGSPENAVAQSTQRLALTQLMMANSIMSLRDIGRCDWKLFVEKQSVMEAVLREDPSGFYPRMTFETRDKYRHVVERIAKRTSRSEESVAQAVVDLARRGPQGPQGANDPRRTHVGYYLVDDGLDELERLSRYSPTLQETVERAVHAHPNVTFIGGLALFTLLVILGVLVVVDGPARAAWGLVLLLTGLPALDIAVSVVMQLVTTWLPPRVLPRLELHEHGVPPEFRTAVVIPTLFGSVDDVREALDNVEVQFLANRGAHLHFAILSDFTDAPEETQPGDDEIAAAAIAGVRALNERHALEEPDAFHLLHRPRRWNAQQGTWMGWERKRGKLSDFNRLIRGDAQDAFSVITGDVSILRDVQYVITLDSDTVLPPDSAPELVGAMAHPLNRAVYDPDRGRVVRGYGILQPRVGVSLPSANRSRFAAIASGHPGVDPYSTAVSDVYQDLYGEGSFTGKGIYDVDAFQLATHGRFPENTLLSHDLIEGNYARAGLATDVIVYDDYPSSYEAHTRRKHRWIRGDWQLLPWLRRMVPGPDGPERNRLSIVSQWKIIDNLRRSTVEIAQVLFFIAGWAILPGSVVRWTLLGLGAVVAPWVVSILLAMVRPPVDKSWRAYYAEVGRDALISLQQAAVALVFLPHQAAVSADAIIRTLYRLLVSGRHLLEWQPASLVERAVAGKPASQARGLRPTTVVVAIGAIALSWLAFRQHFSAGLPLRDLVAPALAMWSVVAFWLAAPTVARRLSR
ncbi:MAG: cyclic beta 1-2 glucan synthetase, partial [Cytophagaceae bacterium]|nr:cyclic beta 1-2 glucan synthetase [Gemmatimonadaceae bacterium]